jgi:hypothetical protein
MGELMLHRDRLKKLGDKLKSIIDKSDGITERHAALEFMQILLWADTGVRSESLEWRECCGESSSLAPPGFFGVDVNTILPPNKAKGTYVSRIERGDVSITGTFHDNEISLAIQFSFAGITVAIGGDGTRNNFEVRRRYEANKKAKINAKVVNLPHHGSRIDCNPGVLDQLFSNVGRRIAVTSADGQSHPDLEVINWLEQNSIEPYCTNLIPACGANVQRLLMLPGIDPVLARWIREVAANLGCVQPCQGDVTVRIQEDGTFDVSPEYRNLCGFRGDYSRLIA